MRIGFLIPTETESTDFPASSRHVTCAGYGAGKAAACSAAAELVFGKHCDTILIWGLAGGLSERVRVGDVVVGLRVAHRDYDVQPLYGSTGVGWVQNFAEDVFAPLDAELAKRLSEELRRIFPDRRVLEGTVCSGDQFVHLEAGRERNRVERESDVVDMESAAVAQFCRNLRRGIRVGVVRVVSDYADGRAGADFMESLKSFAAINAKADELRAALEADGAEVAKIRAAIREYPDFPSPGVVFKDVWGLFANQDVFSAVCHGLYDAFLAKNPSAGITKVAGIESRGFILGFELAQMLGVPFVPLRKQGKLPGEVVADAYRTEYSESCMEAQKDAFSEGDRVLLVDDIIATGGSLLAARNVVEKCGGRCTHAAAIGQIAGLPGIGTLRENGIEATCLFEM